MQRTHFNIFHAYWPNECVLENLVFQLYDGVSCMVTFLINLPVTALLFHYLQFLYKSFMARFHSPSCDSLVKMHTDRRVRHLLGKLRSYRK